MRAPRAAHLSNVTTVRATSLPKTKFTVVSGYPRGEKQENFRRKLAYFLPVHRRKVVKPSDALSRSASGAIAASTAARRGLICPDDVVFAITSPDNARQDETRRITYTLVAGVRRGARSCAREREVENARSRISLVRSVQLRTIRWTNVSVCVVVRIDIDGIVICLPLFLLSNKIDT